MARPLTSLLTFGLEGLFGLSRLPAPFSYPLLCIAVVVMQTVGRALQALRWIIKGGKRHGQGDCRVLRVPDDAFVNLEQYPFTPHYFEFAGHRLHYVDEGPRNATDVVVLIHGMPSWSYCYRKVVPTIVAQGHRVVALDFLGCGRSDMPVDATKYTFSGHVGSIGALLDHVGIRQAQVLGTQKSPRSRQHQTQSPPSLSAPLPRPPKLDRPI